MAKGRCYGFELSQSRGFNIYEMQYPFTGKNPKDAAPTPMQNHMKYDISLRGLPLERRRCRHRRCRYSPRPDIVSVFSRGSYKSKFCREIFHAKQSEAAVAAAV